MTVNNKYFRIITAVCFLLVCLTSGGTLSFLYARYQSKNNNTVGSKVSTTSGTINNGGLQLTQTPSLTSVPTETPSLTPTRTPTPTPSPIPYTLSLDSIPSDITEGNTGSFTWSINGLTKIIHATVIYYGTTSTAGTLTTSATPEDTHYTYVLKDFADGNYTVPLTFVGNAVISSSETYYVRAYALIDGKHYWSSEHSFTVKAIPKNEIAMVNYPSQLSVGQTGTFTWQITGPSATIGYTTIVASKESKSGSLDSTIGIPQTPYSELVKDFTNGPFTVPLTFVGNASFSTTGKYYCRAYTYINGKYIWSDEFTITVE